MVDFQPEVEEMRKLLGPSKRGPVPPHAPVLIRRLEELLQHDDSARIMPGLRSQDSLDSMFTEPHLAVMAKGAGPEDGYLLGFAGKGLWGEFHGIAIEINGRGKAVRAGRPGKELDRPWRKVPALNLETESGKSLVQDLLRRIENFISAPGMKAY